MQSLTASIQSIPGWELMTAEQLRDELTRTRTEPNPQPYTMVAIGEALGPEIRSLVNWTMMRIAIGAIPMPKDLEPVRADIDSARIAMSATEFGLSLHTPERQQLIALIGSLGQWNPAAIAAVQSLGVRSWTLAPPETTVDDVAAAIAALYLEALKHSLRLDAADRYNVHIAAIDNWDGVGAAPVL